MFLSIDVLIASILGLIFMWVAFSTAGNVLVNLFEAAEKATAVADQALTQIDNTMVEFGAKAAALSADVAQVGQDVTDQGIVKTLLPADKEAALTDKVNELKQTFEQAKTAIDGVRSFMQALQAIPFIQTPNLDDSLLGKVNDIILKIEDFVGKIKQGLEDLRNGVAGAIDQISAALQGLSDAVFEARFPLAQLRAYVQAANQVLLPFLQAFTPIFFLFIGAIFTILYGWTAFVMWKFFQWARVWRKGASPTLTPTAAPAAAVESKPADQK
jgi:hypothetical protein